MILVELKYFHLVNIKSTVLLLSNLYMQTHPFFHCFSMISTKEKLLHPTHVLLQGEETKFIWLIKKHSTCPLIKFCLFPLYYITKLFSLNNLLGHCHPKINCSNMDLLKPIYV